MVKNYLVGAVRPVIKMWYPGPNGVSADNPRWNIALQEYNEMYDVSRDSARKFLAGDWEEIKYTAPVLNAKLYQIGQWYMIKELWFREPCNILIATADTMFVRPTEIFGKFDEFRLFNYTDPRGHHDLIQYGQGHYFNNSVAYYPATMSNQTWELGERRMADWFTHDQADWDCGQLIDNHMFWSQEMPEEQRLRPDLNWFMGQREITETSLQLSQQWNNNCPFDITKIIHVAGSRGAGLAARLMKDMAKHIGLEGY